MKIIDAHSHIDYITHNVQPDVVGTVCSTTDESQWQNLIDIINNDSLVYGAFGIHPWFVQNIKDGFEYRLQKLLETNRFYMIGEIGIDKYKPDMDKQIEIFKKQFEISINLHRPVFLHCVGAWDKIFNVLNKYKKSELPIIIAHDFHGSDEILENLLNNHDIMFSFSKNAVYDRIYRIHKIPNNKLLVETDGKKDVLLIDVINKISEIKNDSNICDAIYNNMQRVLKYE